MKVVVLTVTVARLSCREDLIAPVDGARKHLTRMNSLDMFLEHKVVTERLLTKVTRG